MALVTYSKLLSAFPNGVSFDRFSLEIRQSPYISIALEAVTSSNTNVLITFKAELSTPEEAALQQLVENHSGLPLPEPIDSEGRPVVTISNRKLNVQILGREGEQVIRSTHNFCDPTTWYGESERIANEVLSLVSGETLIYESINPNWIDVTHGKLLDEREVSLASLAAGSHGYLVVISSGGVTLTPRPPFATDWSQGGDYWVEYAGPNNRRARVHFQVAPTEPVEATYSKENGSCWFLGPAPGKQLDVEDVDAQFSLPVDMNDTFIFAGVVPNPQNPSELLTIPNRIYSTMAQLIDEARGSYPVIPAAGGTIRGTQTSVYGFPFRYTTVKALKSSQYVRLCVKLQDDIPFGGERVTATFYCTSNTEV